MRFGGFAPVKAMVSHTLNSVSGKWVGEFNLPVLVRRGALGENLPDADLCLTALHPVFVDGFLMPVGELVNGTSIIFEAADVGIRSTSSISNSIVTTSSTCKVHPVSRCTEKGPSAVHRFCASPVAAASFGRACAAWHQS